MTQVNLNRDLPHMAPDKYFRPTRYWEYDYLSMQGLKLIRVSKRGTYAPIH